VSLFDDIIKRLPEEKAESKHPYGLNVAHQANLGYNQCLAEVSEILKGLELDEEILARFIKSFVINKLRIDITTHGATNLAKAITQAEGLIKDKKGE